MSRLQLATLAAFLAMGSASVAAEGGYGSYGGYSSGSGGYSSGGFYPGYGYGGFDRGYGEGGFDRGYGLLRSYGTGYSPGYGYGAYSPRFTYSSGYGSTSSGSATWSGAGVSTRQSASYTPAADNKARVRVRVPAGASLWVGGDATRQTGAERLFVSPALSPGKSYRYEMKARWTEGGRRVEQTRTVQVRANETSSVDFSQPESGR